MALTHVQCNSTQRSSDELVWHLAGSYDTKFLFYTLGQNQEPVSYLKGRLGLDSHMQEMEDKTIS